MCKFNMFLTAVCVLFLIKLRWPKSKRITKLDLLVKILIYLLNKAFVLEKTESHLAGGGGGVLLRILDRGVPRRFLNPNPI